MTDVWTYARFEEKAEIGTCAVQLGTDQLALWRSAAGLPEAAQDAGDVAAPRGLLLALAMRGNLSIVTPRPPGNVHASSVLRWGAVSASIGEPLIVRVICLMKTIAKERRWITLQVDLLNRDDGLVLSNELKMVWAA